MPVKTPYFNVRRIVELLCSSEYNLDTKNLNEITPLMLAILNKRTRFANAILKHKCDPNATNGSIQGASCVHIAAASMSKYSLHPRLDGEILQRLLQKGGNVDVMDKLGNTPLHYAAANRNLDTAEVLIRNVRLIMTIYRNAT